MKTYVKVGLILVSCAGVVILAWHFATPNRPSHEQVVSSNKEPSARHEIVAPVSVDEAAQTGGDPAGENTAVTSAAHALPVSSVALTNRFKTLIEQKSRYPSVELLETFSSEDEAALLELYASETELTNKRALTWILAGVGGDHAASALRQTVLADYDRRALSQAEWTIMRDTMSALVFLSERSDIAYGFLAEASLEEYWERTRMWQAFIPSEETYSNKRFAGLAIKYLGASLRPEAYEKLVSIRESNPNGIEKWGAIVEAKFYHDLVQSRSPDYLVKTVLSGSLSEEYREWRKTDEGKDWWEWGMTAIREHSVEK